MDTQILDAVNEFLVRRKAATCKTSRIMFYSIQKVDSIDEAFVSVIVFKDDDKAKHFTNSLGKNIIHFITYL